RGPVAELRRGGGEHPRGHVHGQAPDGQEPLRRRGRRHAAAEAVREPPAPHRVGLRRLPRNADRLTAFASRRPVGVVAPRLARAADAERLAARLGRLSPGRGADLTAADTPASGAAAAIAGVEVRIVPARRERSSYHARNTGARAAARDWLLFV